MKNLIVFALLFSAQIAIGQKYFSKTGKISFYSEAAMEKIEGHNTSASTVIDASTGAVEWGVLIQGFKFEKSLMQSSIYPKAKFKGKIDNLAIVNFSKDGQYNVNVTGALEIHGVTKTVTTPAVITIKGGAVSARSKFAVAIADYKIEVPKLVAENIAEKVNIEIIADYQLMNPVP